MKFILLTIVLFSANVVVLSQEKGVDTQTQTIKKESGPTTRGIETARTIDWGGGKTRVRRKFDNPFRVPARRDVLINNIVLILADEKFLIDESATRFADGIIVTQSRVFARGPILTKNELNRYAVLPTTDQIWTRGRYTLTIDVRSIDGMQNDVSIVALIEGRSENGIFSEWSTLESSGTAEDEFLTKLVEYIGGDVNAEERKP